MKTMARVNSDGTIEPRKQTPNLDKIANRRAEELSDFSSWDLAEEIACMSTHVTLLEDQANTIEILREDTEPDEDEIAEAEALLLAAENEVEDGLKSRGAEAFNKIRDGVAELAAGDRTTYTLRLIRDMAEWLIYCREKQRNDEQRKAEMSATYKNGVAEQ